MVCKCGHPKSLHLFDDYDSSETHCYGTYWDEDDEEQPCQCIKYEKKKDDSKQTKVM